MGQVVEGRKAGRELGWPTANIDTDGLQLPPDGVYETRVIVGGADYKAVANLGIRPTLDSSGSRVLEVHLLDYQGDLYGMELEVEFLRFLRGEKKFASLDALKAQIVRDVASVQSR
jgi:riboflavin kinase/FMN adenylyltransferase